MCSFHDTRELRQINRFRIILLLHFVIYRLLRRESIVTEQFMFRLSIFGILNFVCVKTL